MKRIILTFVLSLFCLLSFGQNSGTLKFLGIPIDGTESSFAEKLKNKGFVYSSYYDGYRGQFNGQTVTVYIHTNHNLVDRVYVSFPKTTERSIKNDFNTLLRQFKHNNKYTDLSFNEEIPETEDISYEMSINDKHYQASFCYFDPNRDPASLIDPLCDELVKSFPSELVEQMRSTMKDSLNSSDEEQQAAIEDALPALYEKINSDPEKMVLYIATILDAMNSLADGEVWFTIHESGGQYNLGLYYDNCHNRPNGEDL